MHVKICPAGARGIRRARPEDARRRDGPRRCRPPRPVSSNTAEPAEDGPHAPNHPPVQTRHDPRPRWRCPGSNRSPAVHATARSTTRSRNAWRGDRPRVSRKNRQSIRSDQTSGTAPAISTGKNHGENARGGTRPNTPPPTIIQTSHGVKPAKNASATRANGSVDRGPSRQTTARPARQQAGTNANEIAPSTIKRRVTRPDAAERDDTAKEQQEQQRFPREQHQRPTVVVSHPSPIKPRSSRRARREFNHVGHVEHVGWPRRCRSDRPASPGARVRSDENTERALDIGSARCVLVRPHSRHGRQGRPSDRRRVPRPPSALKSRLGPSRDAASLRGLRG